MACLPPTTLEERQACERMQRYLRFAANQQGGSISSHPRASQASTAPRRTGSVPACQDGGRPVAPARPRASANHDARHVLNSNRREQDGGDNGGASVSRTYRPRRGSRYDSNEDRSISPEPPGSRVFSVHIRGAYVPQRYRPPTNITKYAKETNPGLWLDDYRLACRAGGAEVDDFIIRNLPLYLADSAQIWLEHLPAD